MDSDTHFGETLDDSQAVTVAGKVMVSAIILLSVVVAIVVFLHLYQRRNWRRNHDHLAIAQNQQLNLPGGLDPVIIQSLPIIIYNSEEFKDGIECSVCLSELSEGEKARILPKCNHGFHSDCIGMWFQSHSTCPLCRQSISSELVTPDSDSNPEIQIQIPDANQANGRPSEPQNFPTNVLFWGTEDQVRSVGSSLEEGSSSSTSSSSSGNSEDTGKLTIEIPKPLNRFSEEESKSPMITKLKSLTRLLSRGKRTEVSSPNAGDIERGDGGCTPSTKTASE